MIWYFDAHLFTFRQTPISDQDRYFDQEVHMNKFSTSDLVQKCWYLCYLWYKRYHLCRLFSAQAPKSVKIFINLPRSMGFDDAERSEATQALDLSEEDYKDDGLIPLRYVKFQNVNSVTVRHSTRHVLSVQFRLICVALSH